MSDEIPIEGIESGEPWNPEPAAPFEGPDTQAEPSELLPPLDVVPGKRVSASDLKKILRPAFGLADTVNAGRVVYADIKATEDELHDICVPLASIVNRTPPLLALAQRGDGIALALALGRYGVRVGGDHVYNRQQHNNAEIEPTTPPEPAT